MQKRALHRGLSKKITLGEASSFADTSEAYGRFGEYSTTIGREEITVNTFGYNYMNRSMLLVSPQNLYLYSLETQQLKSKSIGTIFSENIRSLEHLKLEFIHPFLLTNIWFACKNRKHFVFFNSNLEKLSDTPSDSYGVVDCQVNPIKREILTLNKDLKNIKIWDITIIEKRERDKGESKEEMGDLAGLGVVGGSVIGGAGGTGNTGKKGRPADINVSIRKNIYFNLPLTCIKLDQEFGLLFAAGDSSPEVLFWNITKAEYKYTLNLDNLTKSEKSIITCSTSLKDAVLLVPSALPQPTRAFSNSSNIYKGSHISNTFAITFAVQQEYLVILYQNDFKLLIWDFVMEKVRHRVICDYPRKILYMNADFCNLRSALLLLDADGTLLDLDLLKGTVLETFSPPLMHIEKKITLGGSPKHPYSPKSNTSYPKYDNKDLQKMLIFDTNANGLQTLLFLLDNKLHMISYMSIGHIILGEGAAGIADCSVPNLPIILQKEDTEKQGLVVVTRDLEIKIVDMKTEEPMETLNIRNICKTGYNKLTYRAKRETYLKLSQAEIIALKVSLEHGLMCLLTSEGGVYVVDMRTYDLLYLHISPVFDKNEVLDISIRDVKENMKFHACNLDLFSGRMIPQANQNTKNHFFTDFTVLLISKKGRVVDIRNEEVHSSFKIKRDLFVSHEGLITLIEVPNSDEIISVGKDGAILTRAIDNNYTILSTISPLWQEVTAADIIGKEKLSLGFLSGTIQSLNFRETQQLKTYKIHDYHHTPIKYIKCIPKSADLFLSVCAENNIAFWSANQELPLRVLNFKGYFQGMIPLCGQGNRLCDLLITVNNNVIRMHMNTIHPYNTPEQAKALCWPEILNALTNIRISEREQLKANKFIKPKGLTEGEESEILFRKLYNIKLELEEENSQTPPEPMLISVMLGQTSGSIFRRILEAEFHQMCKKRIQGDIYAPKFAHFYLQKVNKYIFEKHRHGTKKKKRGKEQLLVYSGEYEATSGVASREMRQSLERINKRKLRVNLPGHGASASPPGFDSHMSIDSNKNEKMGSMKNAALVNKQIPDSTTCLKEKFEQFLVQAEHYNNTQKMLENQNKQKREISPLRDISTKRKAKMSDMQVKVNMKGFITLDKSVAESVVSINKTGGLSLPKIQSTKFLDVKSGHRAYRGSETIKKKKEELEYQRFNEINVPKHTFYAMLDNSSKSKKHEQIGDMNFPNVLGNEDQLGIGLWKNDHTVSMPSLVAKRADVQRRNNVIYGGEFKIAQKQKRVDCVNFAYKPPTYNDVDFVKQNAEKHTLINPDRPCREMHEYLDKELEAKADFVQNLRDEKKERKQFVLEFLKMINKHKHDEVWTQKLENKETMTRRQELERTQHEVNKQTLLRPLEEREAIKVSTYETKFPYAVIFKREDLFPSENTRGILGESEGVNSNAVEVPPLRLIGDEDYTDEEVRQLDMIVPALGNEEGPNIVEDDDEIMDALFMEAKNMINFTAAPYLSPNSTRPMASTPRQLVLITPKIFGLGDNQPHAASYPEYAENFFSAYKIDPRKVIQYLQESDIRENLNMENLKDILLLIGTPVTDVKELAKLKELNQSKKEREKRLAEKQEEMKKLRSERKTDREKRQQELLAAEEEKNRLKRARLLEKENEKKEKLASIERKIILEKMNKKLDESKLSTNRSEEEDKKLTNSQITIYAKTRILNDIIKEAVREGIINVEERMEKLRVKEQEDSNAKAEEERLEREIAEAKAAEERARLESLEAKAIVEPGSPVKAPLTPPIHQIPLINKETSTPADHSLHKSFMIEKLPSYAKLEPNNSPIKRSLSAKTLYEYIPESIIPVDRPPSPEVFMVGEEEVIENEAAKLMVAEAEYLLKRLEEERTRKFEELEAAKSKPEEDVVINKLIEEEEKKREEIEGTKNIYAEFMKRQSKKQLFAITETDIEVEALKKAVTETNLFLERLTQEKEEKSEIIERSKEDKDKPKLSKLISEKEIKEVEIGATKRVGIELAKKQGIAIEIENDTQAAKEAVERADALLTKLIEEQRLKNEEIYTITAQATPETDALIKELEEQRKRRNEEIEEAKKQALAAKKAEEEARKKKKKNRQKTNVSLLSGTARIPKEKIFKNISPRAVKQPVVKQPPKLPPKVAPKTEIKETPKARKSKPPPPIITPELRKVTKTHTKSKDKSLNLETPKHMKEPKTATIKSQVNKNLGRRKTRTKSITEDKQINSSSEGITQTGTKHIRTKSKGKGGKRGKTRSKSGKSGKQKQLDMSEDVELDLERTIELPEEEEVISRVPTPKITNLIPVIAPPTETADDSKLTGYKDMMKTLITDNLRAKTPLPPEKKDDDVSRNKSRLESNMSGESSTYSYLNKKMSRMEFTEHEETEEKEEEDEVEDLVVEEEIITTPRKVVGVSDDDFKLQMEEEEDPYPGRMMATPKKKKPGLPDMTSMLSKALQDKANANLERKSQKDRHITDKIAAKEERQKKKKEVPKLKEVEEVKKEVIEPYKPPKKREQTPPKKTDNWEDLLMQKLMAAEKAIQDKEAELEIEKSILQESSHEITIESEPEEDADESLQLPDFVISAAGLEQKRLLELGMSELDTKEVERQLLAMEELNDCEQTLNVFFDKFEGFNEMETDIDRMLFTNQVNKFLEKAETEDSLNQEDEIEASLRRIKKFKRLIHLLYSSKARKKRRKLSVIKQGTPDQTIADHKDDVKKMIMLMTIENDLNDSNSGDKTMGGMNNQEPKIRTLEDINKELKIMQKKLEVHRETLEGAISQSSELQTLNRRISTFDDLDPTPYITPGQQLLNEPIITSGGSPSPMYSPNKSFSQQVITTPRVSGEISPPMQKGASLLVPTLEESNILPPDEEPKVKRYKVSKEMLDKRKNMTQLELIERRYNLYSLANNLENLTLPKPKYNVPGFPSKPNYKMSPVTGI